METEANSPAADGTGEGAIEEMLLFIARSLADHPTDVRVQFVSDTEGDAFEIQAHGDDLGRLIGKKGQTARALEAIVNSNRRRSGRHFHLDIIGSEDVS